MNSADILISRSVTVRLTIMLLSPGSVVVVVVTLVSTKLNVWVLSVVMVSMAVSVWTCISLAKTRRVLGDVNVLCRVTVAELVRVVVVRRREVRVMVVR